MIALTLHVDVVLAGVAIPSHRTLEVVDEIELYEWDSDRSVLTTGQARALVQAGFAEPIDGDFDALPDLIDAWQRA